MKLIEELYKIHKLIRIDVKQTLYKSVIDIETHFFMLKHAYQTPPSKTL